jgi:hypothetical protein
MPITYAELTKYHLQEDIKDKKLRLEFEWREIERIKSDIEHLDEMREFKEKLVEDLSDRLVVVKSLYYNFMKTPCGEPDNK